MYLCVLPLLTIGLLINLWLIHVIIKYRVLQASSTIYTLSLAFSDLLALITVLIVTNLTLTNPHWNPPQLICGLIEVIRETSISVTAFTSVALSVDRFFAITSAATWMQRHRLHQILALITVILICNNSTTYDDGFQRRPYEGVQICLPARDVYGKYTVLIVIVKFVALYPIPVGIQAHCYYCVVQNLFLKAKTNFLYRKSQIDRTLRKANHTGRLALIMVNVFILCHLPYHLFSLFYNLSGDNSSNLVQLDFWRSARNVTFLCAAINSILNPIFILCSSSKLKKIIKQQLLFKSLFIKQ
ncbi:neuropeptide CCHamide-2 receptor-like [Brevipalpus obovatus]|uniref:neuropeptide CCHamide-2 receptor-like n=1 Tax=Brevipalpus obovatus TaxID=246614 RepID=UPI003D9E1C7B